MKYVTIMLFAFAGTASAASFNCDKAATFVENAICSNNNLSKLDDTLAENYKDMMASDIGEGAKKDLRATQREWLTTRNKCTTVQCVETLYRQRIDAVCDYPVISGIHPDCASADDILAASDSTHRNQATKRVAPQQPNRAQPKTQQQQEAVTPEQARAIADFPGCGSDEGMKEVAHAMENAPMGRVLGLSIIKITSPHQVAATAAARKCTGTALLNNAQSYPISYRFYRDGNDIMIEAEVQGLGGDQ
mgnify:CR=1 FL=1